MWCFTAPVTHLSFLRRDAAQQVHACDIGLKHERCVRMAVDEMVDFRRFMEGEQLQGGGGEAGAALQQVGQCSSALGVGHLSLCHALPGTAVVMVDVRYRHTIRRFLHRWPGGRGGESARLFGAGNGR